VPNGVSETALNQRRNDAECCSPLLLSPTIGQRTGKFGEGTKNGGDATIESLAVEGQIN